MVEENREKVIEEMAKDLEEEFVLCGTLSSCGTKRCSRCFSKYLYEQNYQKLSEDKVMISKAEYNDLKGLEKHFDDYLIKEIVATRKETAYKIYKEYLCDILSLEAKEEFAKQFKVELK